MYTIGAGRGQLSSAPATTVCRCRLPICKLKCLSKPSASNSGQWLALRSCGASARTLRPSPTALEASKIIADVLNEEYKPTNPASLLQVLDREGWGVHTEIARRFSTKFASLTLEGSWDDDLSGDGRVESRRLALLAVYQEWLVARSTLVGRLLDTVERLRPGYLPADLVQRVRTARASGAYLTPDSEVLDGPGLLQLAVLVLPQEQLEQLTERALADTRAEVLALPSYRGRGDLVPALDRGLELLAAGCGRTAETARFRAAHVKEALSLQAELRRRQQKKQEGQQEGNSLLGMWMRQPAAQKASGPDNTARSATDRLYAGQLAPEAPRWMSPADRAAAAAAAPGTTGPRGLPAGRCGLASFRPAPGVTLCGEPGSPGCGSFGGCDRVAFNVLDGAMLDLLARAKTQVPAAAMATFARLHRTALLDALSAWQWQQLVLSGEAARGFFQDRCAHAAAIRPAGPLLVGRHTRLEVAPGPELESLRALVRRRGSEVLDIVHPLARKQVVSAGEWEYWRDAYRLWDRFTSMPPVARGSRFALVLSGEQLPRVLADAATSQGANGGTAAAAAAAAASAAASAAEDLDISSLTSMSSLDLDDAPLPAGILTPAPGEGAGGTGAISAALLGSASTSSNSNTGSSSSSSTGSGSASSSSTGSSAAPLETAALVAVPPAELRAFMSALLTLLPAHVGEAAAAAFGGAGSGSSMAGGGVASGSSSSSGREGSPFRSVVGEWLPARATCLQIRYCPPSTAGDDDDDDDEAAPGKRTPARLPPLAPLVPAAAGAAGTSAADAPAQPLHEEQESSCYELRWAEGALTLNSGTPGTTLSSAMATPALAATVRSALLPSGKGEPLGGRWCQPVRLNGAQLVSLINICTDVAQQVPDLYGLQQPRLIVPTLTPLERLRVAAQGVAESAWRLAGLLALLAVPLAAAIKAGGGDLNAMMAAAATAPPPPVTSRDGGAAASTTGRPQVARSTPSAYVDGGISNVAPAAATRPPSAAAKATAAALAGATPAELVALCRRVEGRLEGRLWLEVTNTTAATGAAAAAAPPAPTADDDEGPTPPPQPEFHLVLDRASGAVLGCKPVNAAGMALNPEFPLAAELRGPKAAEALDKHLSGLTRERIERGKATPGNFQTQYRPVDFIEAPTMKQKQQTQQQPGDEPSSQGAEAAPAAAGAGGVVVLKVELRPAADPGRRVVQGKGKRQREFAAAEVVVRPWYDSDSLLRWMDAGVQLPSLAQEIAAGLLAPEEAQRQAFLDEYIRQVAPAAAAHSGAGNGVVVTIDNSSSAAGAAHMEAAGTAATASEAGTAAAATAAAGPSSSSSAGAGAGGEGRVLQPQELSEQQLQEALKHLFSVLGLPAGSVSIGTGGGTGSGTGASAPKP